MTVTRTGVLSGIFGTALLLALYLEVLRPGVSLTPASAGEAVGFAIGLTLLPAIFVWRGPKGAAPLRAHLGALATFAVLAALVWVGKSAG